MKKKIAVAGLMAVMLLTPYLKQDYYTEGEGTKVIRVSIVESINMDVNEGQFLTPQTIIDNIQGRYK